MEALLVIATPFIIWIGGNIVRGIYNSYISSEKPTPYYSSPKEAKFDAIFVLTTLSLLVAILYCHESYKNIRDGIYNSAPKKTERVLISQEGSVPIYRDIITNEEYMDIGLKKTILGWTTIFLIIIFIVVFIYFVILYDKNAHSL